MARGFGRLRLELSERPADVTLTSVMEGNDVALDLLTKQRAGLPMYDPFCKCTTRVMPVGRVRKYGSSSRVRIDHGADAAEIAGFISEHGPTQNFFPVCHAEDLDGGDGSAFPGLSAGDFLVARGDDGILGVMACWDVMRFRQALVAGYSTAMRRARPWINLWSRLTGGPQLPEAGASFGLAYGSLTLIRDENIGVFHGLLDHALEWTRRHGLDYFVYSMADGDPLGAGSRAFSHHCLHSRIFRVHFEEPATRSVVDARMPHFEGAML